jgi:hypothetical protein
VLFYSLFSFPARGSARSFKKIEGPSPRLGNVYSELLCNKDVDIRLYGKETGKMVLGWTPGKTHLRYPKTVEYEGMSVAYSGYWGVDDDWGRECISIPGTTNRFLVMKAFGYKPGFAIVNYARGGRR